MPVDDKKTIEEALSRVVENRIIYERGILVDSVEPAVAKLLSPALKESLAKAKRKLRDTNLTEWQRRRYIEYRNWAQKELAAPFKKAVPEMRDALEDVARQQGQVAADIISFGGQSPLIRNVGITIAQAKAVVAEPVGGATLADWVAGMGSRFADKVQRQTTAALLEGQTYQQIVKELLSPDGALAKGTRHEAITLARTYVHSVAQRAHNIVMDSRKDLIPAKRWSAVFDNRTCLLCAPLSGRIYAYKPTRGQYPMSAKPPGPPRHPRCRCLLLPVPKSWVEVLGIENTEEGKALLKKWKKFDEPEHGFAVVEKYKIGPKKGKVKPVNVGGAKVVKSGMFKGTFEQWMRAYPSAAKDILGPKRFAMWEAGEVKLKDMLGDGSNVKVLKKLKGGGGGTSSGGPLSFSSTKKAEKWYKRSFSDWAEVQDSRVKEAFRWFKKEGYEPLNKFLRGLASEEKARRWEPRIFEYKAALTRTWKKITLPEDAILYRAANNLPLGDTIKKAMAQGEAVFSKRVSGLVIQDKGYMSTSISKKVADDWAEQTFRFEIRAPKGTPVAPFDAFTNQAFLDEAGIVYEAEIGLYPGTKLKILEGIVEKSPKGKKTYRLICEVIDESQK